MKGVQRGWVERVCIKEKVCVTKCVLKVCIKDRRRCIKGVCIKRGG